MVSLYFLLGLTVVPSRFKLSKGKLSAACRSLLLALKKLGRNAAAMTSLHNGKTFFISFQSQLLANLYSQLGARFFSLVRMLRAFLYTPTGRDVCVLSFRPIYTCSHKLLVYLCSLVERRSSPFYILFALEQTHNAQFVKHEKVCGTSRKCRDTPWHAVRGVNVLGSCLTSRKCRQNCAYL